MYPVCTPARASLQTGVYPCRHGMQNNIYQPGCVVHELTDSPRLLSRQLVANGYSAGHTGKWHLGFGSAAHNDPWYEDESHDVEGSLNVVDYPNFYRVGSSLPTDLGYEGDNFPGHGGGGHSYKQYQDYLQANDLSHILKDPNSSTTEVISPKESTIDYFLTEPAIHFIDRFNRRERPFFFGLHFWGPHGPAYVPSKYYERYRNMNLEPWPSFYEDQEDKPMIHNMKRSVGEWESYEQKIKYTFAYSEFIDDEIGRLIEKLKDDGIYDNSYIIMSCDHGDSLGCHDVLSDKGFHMYEETTHIPLIIKLPKCVECKSQVDELVNTTDIYSTILDMAGVSTDLHERDGRSLLPLMKGEEVKDWTDCVVTEFTGLGYSACSQRMIRIGDYKYVFNAGDKEELYHLKRDPYELKNLSREVEFAKLITEMRHRLYEWLKAHNDKFSNDFRTYIQAMQNEREVM